jgi:hypothetical protein
MGKRGFGAVVTAAVVLVVGVSGCGGGDDDASTTTVSRPELATTTVSVVPPGALDANDQEAAEAAVLQQGDVPAGWQRSPWALGDQPLFAQADDSCRSLHFVDETDGLSAVAHSDVYQSPALLAVATKVQVYPTEDAAGTAMAAFTVPEAGRCLSSSVSAAQTGPQAGSPEIDIAPTEVGTSGAVAFWGTVRSEGGAGPSTTVALGYAAALRGRALVVVTTTGIGDRPPDFSRYLDPVVARLAPFAQAS